MSKITPYTALCDIFRHKINASDKIIADNDEKMDIPTFFPKKTLNIDNSCQTHPLRDYSVDKVVKSKKLQSTKNNMTFKDDNFKILHPDYAAYTAQRPYSQARHNKFKLVAEKPQEEMEKKLKGRSSSLKSKKLTDLYRKIDGHGSTMTSHSLKKTRHQSPTKYRTSSIVNRVSNELLFPDLNLYSRKTNPHHVHDKEYTRSPRNEPYNPYKHHSKPINSFKEQHISALYRTVSDLKEEFAARYPHCEEEDEKCLCEHCGAWAVIDESLKRPQIFETADDEEVPKTHKHSKKRNDKEYLKLLMKLKAMEDRLNELEEIAYIQGPIKMGKSSLTFDMYTQCHKKKKRTRFQEPEQSKSFSPKRFNPKSCPFPFGLPPNIKEKFFWKKSACSEVEEDKPEETESEEDVKVQHESRSKRRRLLPRPKLRCHEYINKKKEEEDCVKKAGFWKHNKQTYNVHSVDNSEVHVETDDDNKTEKNKTDTIEINLDTITDKQIQDLLIELNKRKNRIASPEAKIVRFHVSQNDDTKVLYKRDKDDVSSHSAVPSDADLPYFKSNNPNIPSKEASEENIPTNDSFDYFFLKQPDIIKKLVQVELEPPPQEIPTKPSTRIIMEPKDFCSLTIDDMAAENEDEVKNMVDNIITSATMCKYFNNNFSNKTSTTNGVSSRESNPKKTKGIPVRKNKNAKPKKHVEHLADNKKRLNTTLPNSRDVSPVLPPKVYDNTPKNFIELNKNVRKNLRTHQFSFESDFFYQPVPKKRPKKENTTVSFNSQITTFPFEIESDKAKNRKKWNFPCLDVKYNKSKITSHNKLESNDNILLKLSKLPLESQASSLRIFNSGSTKGGQTDESKEDKIATSDAESNTTEKKDAQSGYSTENIATETDSTKTEPKNEPKPEKTETKPENTPSKDTTTKKSSFFGVLKKFSKQFIPRKVKPLKPAVKNVVIKPIEPTKKPPPIIVKSPIMKTTIKTKIPTYQSPEKNLRPRSADSYKSTSPDSTFDRTAFSSDSCNSKKVRQHIFPKEAQNYNVLLCMNKNKKKLKFKGAEKFDKYCMFKPQMMDKGTNQSVENIPDDCNNERTDLTINTIILSNIESFFQSNNTSSTPFNNIIIFSRPTVRNNMPIIREQSSSDSVFSNLSIQTSLIQNLMPSQARGRSIVNNNQLVLYSNCSTCKKSSYYDPTPAPSRKTCSMKEHDYQRAACGKDDCSSPKGSRFFSMMKYHCRRASEEDLYNDVSRCDSSPCDSPKKRFSFKMHRTRSHEMEYEPACQTNRSCCPPSPSCGSCKSKPCVCVDDPCCKKKKNIFSRECKGHHEYSKKCRRRPEPPAPVQCESSESLMICCRQCGSNIEVCVSEDELPPPKTKPFKPKCNKKLPPCGPVVPPCCPMRPKCTPYPSIPRIPSHIELQPIRKKPSRVKSKTGNLPWYMNARVDDEEYSLPEKSCCNDQYYEKCTEEPHVKVTCEKAPKSKCFEKDTHSCKKDRGQEQSWYTNSRADFNDCNDVPVAKFSCKNPPGASKTKCVDNSPTCKPKGKSGKGFKEPWFMSSKPEPKDDSSFAEKPSRVSNIIELPVTPKCKTKLGEKTKGIKNHMCLQRFNKVVEDLPQTPSMVIEPVPATSARCLKTQKCASQCLTTPWFARTKYSDDDISCHDEPVCVPIPPGKAKCDKSRKPKPYFAQEDNDSCYEEPDESPSSKKSSRISNIIDLPAIPKCKAKKGQKPKGIKNHMCLQRFNKVVEDLPRTPSMVIEPIPSTTSKCLKTKKCASQCLTTPWFARTKYSDDDISCNDEPECVPIPPGKPKCVKARRNKPKEPCYAQEDNDSCYEEPVCAHKPAKSKRGKVKPCYEEEDNDSCYEEPVCAPKPKSKCVKPPKPCHEPEYDDSCHEEHVCSPKPVKHKCVKPKKPCHEPDDSYDEHVCGPKPAKPKCAKPKKPLYKPDDSYNEHVCGPKPVKPKCAKPQQPCHEPEPEDDDSCYEDPVCSPKPKLKCVKPSKPCHEPEPCYEEPEPCYEQPEPCYEEPEPPKPPEPKCPWDKKHKNTKKECYDEKTCNKPKTKPKPTNTRSYTKSQEESCVDVPCCATPTCVGDLKIKPNKPQSIQTDELKCKNMQKPETKTRFADECSHSKPPSETKCVSTEEDEQFPKILTPTSHADCCDEPPSVIKTNKSKCVYGLDKASSAVNIPNKGHKSICVGTQAYAADCKTGVKTIASNNSIASDNDCSMDLDSGNDRKKCPKIKSKSSICIKHVNSNASNLSENCFSEFQADFRKLGGKTKTKKCPKSKKLNSSIHLSECSLQEFEKQVDIITGKKRKKVKECVPKKNLHKTCMGSSGLGIIKQINSDYSASCLHPHDKDSYPMAAKNDLCGHKPNKKTCFKAEPTDSLTIIASRSNTSISAKKKVEKKIEIRIKGGQKKPLCEMKNPSCDVKKPSREMKNPSCQIRDSSSDICEPCCYIEPSCDRSATKKSCCDTKKPSKGKKKSSCDVKKHSSKKQKSSCDIKKHSSERPSCCEIQISGSQESSCISLCVNPRICKAMPKHKSCDKRCNKKQPDNDSQCSQNSSLSNKSSCSDLNIKVLKKPPCQQKQVPPCQRKSSGDLKKKKKQKCELPPCQKQPEVQQKTSSCSCASNSSTNISKQKKQKPKKKEDKCKCPVQIRKPTKQGKCARCKKTISAKSSVSSKSSQQTCKSVRISSKTKTIKPKKKKSKPSLKSKTSKSSIKSKGSSTSLSKKKKPKPKKKPSKKSIKSKTSSASVAKKPKEKQSKKSVKCKESTCSALSAATTIDSKASKDPDCICDSETSISSKKSKTKCVAPKDCKNKKCSGSSTKIGGKASVSKASSRESLRQGSSESICSQCKKQMYGKQTFVKKSLCQVRNKITSKFSCKYFKSLYRRPICAVTSKYKQRQSQRKNNFCDVSKTEFKRKNSPKPQKKSRSSSQCPCSSSVINLFYNVESSFFDNDNEDTYSWSETDEDLILSSEDKRQYLLEKLNLLQDFRGRIDPEGLSNYGSFQ